MGNYGLSGFPGLVDIPAFKSFSSLRVLVQRLTPPDILVNTETDDGFQLSYSLPGGAGMRSDWLDAAYGADPSLAFHSV